MLHETDKSITEIMFGKKQVGDDMNIHTIYLAENEPDYIQVMSPEKADELMKKGERICE